MSRSNGLLGSMGKETQRQSPSSEGVLGPKTGGGVPWLIDEMPLIAPTGPPRPRQRERKGMEHHNQDDAMDQSKVLDLERSGEFDGPDFDVSFTRPAGGERPGARRRRSLGRPLAGIAAIATVIVVLGGVSLLFRDAKPPPQGAGVEGSVADESSSSCSRNVTRDTVYLGGPAWQGNLAADGFIFSLPAGTPAADLAATFVSRAVVGGGCEQRIFGSNESEFGEGRIAVGVDVIPSAGVRLMVETAAKEEVSGITGVRGATAFDVVTGGDTPVLQLAGSLPPEAESMTVRFRKGKDVWELSVSNNDSEIVLAVPSAETDRFPDARPEWVLFTVYDRDGVLLDAGGTLIPREG